MKYFIKFFLLINFSVLLISCGNNWSEFRKTMSGEKTTNTDEFLIKKKDPLVLPPEYGKLPLPKSNKKKSQEATIENVLRSNDNTKNETKVSSDLENIILRELKK